MVTRFYVSNFIKQILTFYDNRNFAFFSNFGKKRELEFINFLFWLYSPHSHPHSSHSHHDSLHPHPDSSHSHPDSPHSHPDSTHSHPNSPHSHPDSPHSHPDSLHSHHSPHPVPRFPIPAFTISHRVCRKFYVDTWD